MKEHVLQAALFEDCETVHLSEHCHNLTKDGTELTFETPITEELFCLAQQLDEYQQTSGTDAGEVILDAYKHRLLAHTHDRRALDCIFDAIELLFGNP